MQIKNKGFIGVILVIIVAALILGGGYYAYEKNAQRAELNATTSVDVDLGAGNIDTNLNTNLNTNSTTTVSTGIKGNATISPTCAGGVTPEQDCEKGYATTFVVSTIDGKFVKNFESDANGNFQVDLPPGQYKITHESSTILPRMGVVNPVTVNASGYTNLHISFDSGIN